MIAQERRLTRGVRRETRRPASVTTMRRVSSQPRVIDQALGPPHPGPVWTTTASRHMRPLRGLRDTSTEWAPVAESAQCAAATAGMVRPKNAKKTPRDEPRTRCRIASSGGGSPKRDRDIHRALENHRIRGHAPIPTRTHPPRGLGRLGGPDPLGRMRRRRQPGDRGPGACSLRRRRDHRARDGG